MSIEVAFHGFVTAAEPKISKAGKPWVRLRVGVGKDDGIQWLSVSVFGNAAEAAAALKKGDRCYIEGSIKLDTWRGNDGIERHGLSVAAHKCEKTHQIGRNKPARNDANGDAKSRSQEKPASANAFHDDDIPF